MEEFSPNSRTCRKYLLFAVTSVLLLSAAYHIDMFVFFIAGIATVPSVLVSTAGYFWVSRFHYRVDEEGLTISRPFMEDLTYLSDTLGEPYLDHSFLAGRHVRIPTTKTRYGRNTVIIPAHNATGLQNAIKNII